MNRKRLLLAMASVTCGTIAAATSPLGADFEIPSFTIDGGGGTSSGGGFELTGIIGQPEAGTSSGGDFELAGGFQPAPAPAPCPEDVNGDGTTDVLDLIELLLCFGLPADPPCDAPDINGDGTVDVLDLIVLLLSFGTSCP